MTNEVRIGRRDRRRHRWRVDTRTRMISDRYEAKSTWRTLQDDWKPFRRRQRRRSFRVEGNPLRLLLLIAVVPIFLTDQVRCSSGGANRANPGKLHLVKPNPQSHPSVVLPKLGLVRGLRFDHHHEKEGQPQEAVAAFLGIPYAAPPTGPLRFMPPGAARPSSGGSLNKHTPRQSEQHCDLWLSATNGSWTSATMPSRALTEFGYQCVLLSDWLPQLDDLHQTKHIATIRQQQSEDCLNLNVFAPYEPPASLPFVSRRRKLFTSSSSRLPRAATTKRTATAKSIKVKFKTKIETNRPTGQNTNGNERSQLADMQRKRRHVASFNTSHDDQQPTVKMSINGAQGEGDAITNHSISNCYLEDLPFVGARSRQPALPVIILFHSRRPWRLTKAKRFDGETNGRDDSEGDANGDQTANSLVNVEMARQTRTIVITFNHRIGLLGHLPYIDLEQSQQTAELAHHDHHQTRSNHALWDQIGLLHWIKHNVGHFGGDQNNVTLMAADNEAAATIQLLALSPLAKGHFKRIVLVHDSARTPSPPANYFDHLFRLAERSRQFRRKLVSELGLIVRRDESAPDPSDDQDPQQLDRRAFELLKSAPLARLALIEHELARVSVTMTSNSQQLATWTSLSQKQTPVSNLAQFVGEPNLDDKLLFPFFAQLIKANQSLGGGGDHEPSVSFWSSLRHSVEWATSTVDPNSSLENLQLESDYCLYMQRLYSSMFEAESLSGSHQHENVTNELNQFDPLKLIPRLSDHQLMMMLNLSVAINVSSSPPQAPLEEDLQHQQTRQFIRWTGQKNRTANALEFHHLHRAHLMQQLLIQKLERHFNLTSGPSSTATIRPRDLTVGIQVDDNEDEEEGEPAASIQQQQQQRSISLMQQQQAGAGLSRTKRDVLDQLAALAKQCIELLGSFDLLVVFAGAPTSQRVDNVELVTKNNSLIETMNDLVSSDLAKTLESGFQDYLHLADLHRVSSLHQAPGHLNELCQFKRLQNSSHLRVRLQASSRIQASIRSGFVLLVDQEEETGPMVSDRTFFTKSNANVTQMIANFAASGQLTSNQSDQYQTLDRPLVGVGQQREDDGVLRDLMSIQLDLVPYLLIHPEQHPPEMVSCLRELELILLNDDGDKTRRLAMANLTLVRFQEESHCLTNVTNKLRNQLRSGAAKELEPVIRQYFATLNEQQRQLKSSPSSDDRQQQMALVDAASAAVRHNSQRASPMTTRNLLNHLEGPYLDQMAPPLAGFLDHQQTLDGGGGGGGGNLSGAYQTVRVGNGHQKSAAPNSTSGNIRSFFTKNYKDAVSQALAIVLGTGFLIFVLNLVIVLVIAIRSRGSVRSQTCNVQESSLADGDLAGMTNTTNLTALTGAQQQQLTIPPLSLLNGLIDLATANGSLDVGKQLVTGKMLTSSFKGPQQTSHPEELHQQHSMRQLPAQQSRSSLSSNSQRVSKSIKFDLTGTEGQDQRMTMRIGSNNNSTLQSTWSTADSGQYRTKSIMKQQPTTSDEDELQLTDHQMLPANNNNCLHYHIESPYLLDVDPNSPMANGRLLSPLNSLDHLTPIMNTGGYESEDFELQALAMMTGHDHQHQALLADSNNSDKCQHHYHLVRQQHHGPQASLGSSSLNSPFASQSTPTHSGSNGQIFAIMVSAQDQLLLDEQRQ